MQRKTNLRKKAGNPKQNKDHVSMTDKEKADCLIELHKSQLDHFKQTRDIELKVDIALWTLIIASGSFLYGKIYLTDPASRTIYQLIAFVIILGHTFLWKEPIQNSEDIDDYFINQYRNEVEKLTGVLINKPAKRLRKSGWPWILVGIGITTALLLAIGILLSLPPI